MYDGNFQHKTMSLASVCMNLVLVTVYWHLALSQCPLFHPFSPCEAGIVVPNLERLSQGPKPCSQSHLSQDSNPGAPDLKALAWLTLLPLPFATS